MLCYFRLSYVVLCHVSLILSNLTLFCNDIPFNRILFYNAFRYCILFHYILSYDLFQKLNFISYHYFYLFFIFQDLSRRKIFFFHSISYTLLCMLTLYWTYRLYRLYLTATVKIEKQLFCIKSILFYCSFCSIVFSHMFY
jgi:hypothetical protein